MKSKIISSALIGALSLGLVSCGGSSDGGGRPRSSASEQQTTPITESGSYFAILRTMNNSLSGYLPTGQAQVKIENGLFKVKTVLEDDAPVVHYQALYSGSSCPTEADDLNGDGYVDVDEMESKTGMAIVPLDSDLTDQLNGFFVKGRSMTYSKTVSIDALTKSVFGEDLDAADHVTKLLPGQVFGVSNRVIVIHGVSSSKGLPASVATLPGQTAQASMPIACGVLQSF